MLAKPAATLPAGSALLGGTVYEPKWDGYRAILERKPQGCRVWSRNGADLSSGFPEVVTSACDQLRPGTVVDGELVVWSDGRLDFAALEPRLAYRGRRRDWRPRPSSPSMFWPSTTSTCEGSRCGCGDRCSSSSPNRGARRCS